MTDDVLFTVDQIAACNTALRTALGKPPEHVPAAQFIGMISQEIRELRSLGWGDADIAALVAESTGSVMSTAAIEAVPRDPFQVV